MTLLPQTNFAIPEEAIYVACAAYPCRKMLMKIHNATGFDYHAPIHGSVLRSVDR